MNQGLKMFSNWKKTPMSGQNRINDIFRGLDGNKDLLNERLNAGQDLFPQCDTSIWFRNCTHEIPSPIQGIIKGKYEFEHGEYNS